MVRVSRGVRLGRERQALGCEDASRVPTHHVRSRRARCGNRRRHTAPSTTLNLDAHMLSGAKEAAVAQLQAQSTDGAPCNSLRNSASVEEWLRIDRSQAKNPYGVRVCGGSPSGIRTRVTAVRGRRPRPLDDRAVLPVMASNHEYLSQSQACCQLHQPGTRTTVFTRKRVGLTMTVRTEHSEIFEPVVIAHTVDVVDLDVDSLAPPFA